MQLDGRTIRIEGKAGAAELLCLRGYLRQQRGEAVFYLTQVDGDLETFHRRLQGHNGTEWVGKGLGVTVFVDGVRVATEFEYEYLEHETEGDDKSLEMGGYTGAPPKLTQDEIAKLRELKGKA